MENKKIQDFKDLHAWQEGHSLVISVYKITKDFPREELYSLVNQMRRAAVSVTSNIAEGFGRYGYKERANFYSIARGSLTELENQIILSRDLGYIKNEMFENIYLQLKTVQRLLCGLISKTKSFVYPISVFFILFFVLYAPFSMLCSPCSFLPAPSSMLRALFSVPPAHASTIGKPVNFLSINTGLVGWWTFDGKDTPWTSATAATTLDKSGNYATGTLTSMSRATAPAQGKIGQGLKFDGVDDIVTVAHSANLNNYPMSVSIWFNTTKTTGAIINKYTYPSGWNIDFFDGVIQYSYLRNYDNGNYAYLGNLYTVTGLNNGKWHQVAMVVDASGANIYIDGVWKQVQAWTGTAGVQTDTSSVKFGKDRNDVYTGGIFDDARIYNRALSQAEITQLYNLGAATKVAASPRVGATTGCSSGLSCGLVGWWTFDGKDTPWTSATAATTLDKSGNYATGTLNNMNRSINPAQGKIGQGLYFDYVDDAVTIPTSITDGASAMTASYWVKFDSSFDTTGSYPLSKWRSGFTTWVFARDSNTGSPNVGQSSFDVETSVGVASAESDSRFPTDTKWHHVVGVYDGANVYIYGDGVSLDSSANPITGALLTFGHPICVGSAWTGSWCEKGFKGKIDDVRVYNRALSVTEIQQLYNLGR